MQNRVAAALLAVAAPPSTAFAFQLGLVEAFAARGIGLAVLAAAIWALASAAVVSIALRRDLDPPDPRPLPRTALIALGLSLLVFWGTGAAASSWRSELGRNAAHSVEALALERNLAEEAP